MLHTRCTNTRPAQALATPIRLCALTLARLPSHFLLPFTTTIETLPGTSNVQGPKLKARLQPGRPADFTEDTLAQTSYVLNRQDSTRHLSRQKHWTNLISERQKEKFASMAHRSSSSNKLVQDHWVWEDQVPVAAAMLEEKAVDAIKLAVKVRGGDKCSSSSAMEESAFALAFNHDDSRDSGVGQQAEPGCEAHKLSTLLPPESLIHLRHELAQDSTGIVYIPISPEACQAQLAIDRLKAYKKSNEVHKDLPQVQNAPGTRAARLKREEAEREAFLSGEDKVDGAV